MCPVTCEGGEEETLADHILLLKLRLDGKGQWMIMNSGIAEARTFAFVHGVCVSSPLAPEMTAATLYVATPHSE